MGPRILNGKLKKWELQEMMFNGKLKGLEIARRDGIMVHRLQSRALAKQYIWLFCPFFCPFVLLRMIHNALWRNRWCRSHDTFIPLGAKLWYKTTQEIVHTFTILFIILKRIKDKWLRATGQHSIQSYGNFLDTQSWYRVLHHLIHGFSIGCKPSMICPKGRELYGVLSVEL